MIKPWGNSMKKIFSLILVLMFVVFIAGTFLSCDVIAEGVCLALCNDTYDSCEDDAEHQYDIGAITYSTYLSRTTQCVIDYNDCKDGCPVSE